jgi:hypothetical protein
MTEIKELLAYQVSAQTLASKTHMCINGDLK